MQTQNIVNTKTYMYTKLMGTVMKTTNFYAHR